MEYENEALKVENSIKLHKELRVIANKIADIVMDLDNNPVCLNKEDIRNLIDSNSKLYEIIRNNNKFRS